jgi:hypothetical protein
MPEWLGTRGPDSESVAAGLPDGPDRRSRGPTHTHSIPDSILDGPGDSETVLGSCESRGDSGASETARRTRKQRTWASEAVPGRVDGAGRAKPSAGGRAAESGVTMAV